MKIAMLFVLAGLVFLCPSLAFGSVMVSLNNEGSTTLHEITVARGGTFNMDVNLSTNGSLVSLGFDLAASQSDCFDVIAVIDQYPWSSGGASLVGGLDPQSTMGASVPFPEIFGPGTSTLATVELAADPACPNGTYSLDVAGGTYMFHWAVPGYAGITTGPAFIVHVVPEPSPVLMVFVLALALDRRWF